MPRKLLAATPEQRDLEVRVNSIKWHVQMIRFERSYLSFDVEATDENAARRKARQYAQRHADDFCDREEGPRTEIRQLYRDVKE